MKKGGKKDVIRKREENYIKRSFIICTLQVRIRMIKSREVSWPGHVTRMSKINSYTLFGKKKKL